MLAIYTFTRIATMYLHRYTFGANHAPANFKMGKQPRRPSACPASFTKQVGVNSGDYLEANIDASGEMHLVPNAPKVDKAAMLKKISALHKTVPRTTSVLAALRKEARY